VLPALALWFVTLSAAYRLRLLDRILGVGQLPPSGADRPEDDDGAADRRLRPRRKQWMPIGTSRRTSDVDGLPLR
jgi:hypothetical protein